MTIAKYARSSAVAVSAALVLGALTLGGPAEAAKACRKFKPAAPNSDSASAADAPKEKVLKITDKYTKKKPLMLTYSHGPALWLISDPSGDTPQGQRPIVEDSKWFPIQVDSKKKSSYLSIRQEWAATPLSDMDIYLYDRYGSQVNTSGDFNEVQGTPLNSGTGGQGYEQISNQAAADCTGFVIESRAFSTKGEDMKLKIWLGS